MVLSPFWPQAALSFIAKALITSSGMKTVAPRCSTSRARIWIWKNRWSGSQRNHSGASCLKIGNSAKFLLSAHL